MPGSKRIAALRECARRAVCWTAPATADSRRVNVLVIDDSVPAPDRDSGSVRLTAVLEILRALGCNLTFVARGVEFGGPTCSGSGPWASKCFASPTYGTSDSCWRPGAGIRPGVGVQISSAQECVTAVRRCAPRSGTTPVRGDPRAGTGDGPRRGRHAGRRSERNALLAEVPDADVRIVSNVLPIASSGPGFGARDMLFVGAFSHAPMSMRSIGMHARCGRGSAAGCPMPDPGDRQRHAGAVRNLAGDGMEAVMSLTWRPTCSAAGCRSRRCVRRGREGKDQRGTGFGLPVVATSIAVEGMNLESGGTCWSPIRPRRSPTRSCACTKMNAVGCAWHPAGGRTSRGISPPTSRVRSSRGWSKRPHRREHVRRDRGCPATSFSCLPPMAAWGTARWCRGDRASDRFPNARIDLLSICCRRAWRSPPASSSFAARSSMQSADCASTTTARTGNLVSARLSLRSPCFCRKSSIATVSMAGTPSRGRQEGCVVKRSRSCAKCWAAQWRTGNGPTRLRPCRACGAWRTTPNCCAAGVGLLLDEPYAASPGRRGLAYGSARRSYSTSAAWSASRERSPRCSVTWPECPQPLKRSTTYVSPELPSVR